MNNKTHLPLYGVGPVYVYTIMLLTVVGIGLSVWGKLPVIQFDFMKLPFMLIGSLMIFLGIIFWILAVFSAHIDVNIKRNTLVTDGIYAWVRNPIYSAFMMACTGALLVYGNIGLFFLPFVFWAILTVLMKHTEEKWLAKLYGREYEEYCRRVNRCIPWKRKK